MIFEFRFSTLKATKVNLSYYILMLLFLLYLKKYISQGNINIYHKLSNSIKLPNYYILVVS